MRQFFVSLICLLWILPAKAETPPTPDRLSPHWFEYVSESGEDLSDRLDALGGAIGLFADELEVRDPGTYQQAASILAELEALIAQYKELASQEPVAGPVPAIAPSELLVQELIEHVRHYREAQVQATIAADAISQAMEMERFARQLLDTKVAAYLSLAPGDSRRSVQGAVIMRDRFMAAVAQEEKRISEPAAEVLRENAEVLKRAVEAASANLSVDEQSVQVLDEKEAEAKSLFETRQSELAAQRLRRSAAPNAADSNVLSNLRSLEVEMAEVGLAIAELQFHRLSLLKVLAQHLESNEPVAQSARDLQALLRTHQSELEVTRRNIVSWQSIAERARAASIEQLSALSENDMTDVSGFRDKFTMAIESTESVARLRELLERSRLLHDVVDRRIQSDLGTTASVVGWLQDSIGTTWATLTRIGGYSLFTIDSAPVTPAGILRVFLILAAAYWISRAARAGFARVGERGNNLSKPALYTLNRLFHYVILTVGFLVALTSIGIDFTRFAILLSALGVGLGFGLQAIFSNFVSGLIILFEKSLKVGDFVDLESGVTGEVREINIRSTLVTTNDNVDILVPNSEFVSGRVTNWTLRDTVRRVRIPFGVAYGTDKDLVRKAGLEAAESIEYTLRTVPSRQPQVWLVGFGDSALDFELVVWLTDEATKKPAAVNAAYNWALETALGKYGIEIPFPQRDLHIRSSYADQPNARKEPGGDPSPDIVPEHGKS